MVRRVRSSAAPSPPEGRHRAEWRRVGGVVHHRHVAHHPGRRDERLQHRPERQPEPAVNPSFLDTAEERTAVPDVPATRPRVSTEALRAGGRSGWPAGDEEPPDELPGRAGPRNRRALGIEDPECFVDAKAPETERGRVQESLLLSARGLECQISKATIATIPARKSSARSGRRLHCSREFSQFVRLPHHCHIDEHREYRHDGQRKQGRQAQVEPSDHRRVRNVLRQLWKQPAHQ